MVLNVTSSQPAAGFLKIGLYIVCSRQYPKGNHGQRAVPPEEAAAQTGRRKSTITFFAALFS
jgi:hypothetical protein